jgi:hypothetical protein
VSLGNDLRFGAYSRSLARPQVFDELRDRWAQRIGVEELERLEEALADLGIRTPSRFDAPGWFAGSSPE